MFCLSLTQPWATLVAIGAKRIETRSWATKYRGPLAIHASKGFPVTCKDLVGQMPFSHALSPHFRDGHAGVVAALPLGAVIATCRLVDCKLIVGTPHGLTPSGKGRMLPPIEPEFSFGDYTPGRYGWILEDVKLLPAPVPAKGMLGLWEWRPAA